MGNAGCGAPQVTSDTCRTVELGAAYADYAQNAAGGADMADWLVVPGTILLFLAIFVVCILWATHGHPSNADNEDLGVVAKDH
jgi:hypothetical protein